MRLCYVADVIAVPGGVLTSRWRWRLRAATATARQLSEAVDRCAVAVYAMPGGRFLGAWRGGRPVPADENVLYQVRGQTAVSAQDVLAAANPARSPAAARQEPPARTEASRTVPGTGSAGQRAGGSQAQPTMTTHSPP